MWKAMRRWFLVAIGFVLLASSLALAQGKAYGRNGKPPGWGKGEKKGWQSDVPPGLEKKLGGMPPGLSQEGHGRGNPPGWSRGEKEGWSGNDRPPALAKKKEKGKKK